MKSKLIGLFLLIWVTGFSQSVPNTTTFSLQDVIDAVSPSSNDLVECFNDANPNYFNDTYNDDSYAPANSLLRFRDYGAHNAAATAPTVTTGSATNITYYSVTLAGNVTSDGGSAITERGIKISLSSDLSSGVSTISTSGTTGNYTVDVSTLTCFNTTYYYQAYAQNNIGTSTGTIQSFTTATPTLITYDFVGTYDFNGTNNIAITSEATARLAALRFNFYSGLTSVRSWNTFRVISLSAGAVKYWESPDNCIETQSDNGWVIVLDGGVYKILETNGNSITSVSSLTTTAYTASGTWTKPSNVTDIYVEAWGGGGTGGGATGTGARAAGGTGGTYASKVISVPNATYAYVVGATRTASATVVRNGNPTSFGSTLVIATGGIGGAVNATTGGATATTAATTGSVGDVIYAGGNGGAGTSASYSGGGGGGAGSTGAGGNATNQTAGTGTSQNGGNGAAGRNTAGAGVAGSIYGGGGAGGCATTTTDRAGGSGAAGLIRITY